MRRKPGLTRNEALSRKQAEVRDCGIRTAIGRMLGAQFDLAQPLSDRLEDLLRRLDGGDEMNALEVPPR